MTQSSHLSAAETLAALTSGPSFPSSSSTATSSSTGSSAETNCVFSSSSNDSQHMVSSSATGGDSASNSQTFFPLKLHQIISDESNADIIQWLPSGKAFIIVDKNRFAQEILPRFFSQQCKFTSFTRKLTRWRFNRVPRGPLIGAYYHELFGRNQQNLCYQMDCKSETKGGSKFASLKQQLKKSNVFQENSVSLNTPRPYVTVPGIEQMTTTLPPLVEPWLQRTATTMTYPSHTSWMQDNPPSPLLLPNIAPHNIHQYQPPAQVSLAKRVHLGAEILVIEESIRKLDQVRIQQQEKEATLLQAYRMLARRTVTHTSSFSV